jgi:glucose-6-phosphate isomerase
VFGCSEFEGIFLDYSRQQATGETIEKLLKLAEVTPVSHFIISLKRHG